MMSDKDIQANYWSAMGEQLSSDMIRGLVSKHKGKPLTLGEAIYHVKVRLAEILEQLATSLRSLK